MPVNATPRAAIRSRRPHRRCDTSNGCRCDTRRRPPFFAQGAQAARRIAEQALEIRLSETLIAGYDHVGSRAACSSNSDVAAIRSLKVTVHLSRESSFLACELLAGRLALVGRHLTRLAGWWFCLRMLALPGTPANTQQRVLVWQ